MKSVIELAKSVFQMYRIDVFISGEVEPQPLPESIKKHIRGSDTFFAILTEKHSDWIQNEIGIAYEAGIPIYAIVQENLEVEGILPFIVIYEKFNLKNPLSIIGAISRVVEKIDESRTEGETAEIYKMLKNKRERIIYQVGIHAASYRTLLLLILKDLNPAFFEVYNYFHEKELEKLLEELKLLE